MTTVGSEAAGGFTGAGGSTLYSKAPGVFPALRLPLLLIAGCAVALNATDPSRRSPRGRSHAAERAFIVFGPLCGSRMENAKGRGARGRCCVASRVHRVDSRRGAGNTRFPAAQPDAAPAAAGI